MKWAHKAPRQFMKFLQMKQIWCGVKKKCQKLIILAFWGNLAKQLIHKFVLHFFSYFRALWGWIGRDRSVSNYISFYGIISMISEWAKDVESRKKKFFQNLWKVGVISWLLFHLIWKNYALHSKSWIVDFFTREKTPQNNFSRQCRK